jgi:hypothetical protein
MKKLLWLALLCSAHAHAQATCGIVIFNDAQEILPNTRAENIGEICVPLCSDLPEYLQKDPAYRDYCDNPRYDPKRVLYGKYSNVAKCSDLIGNQWYVTVGASKPIWSHTISIHDLISSDKIVLHFPDKN